jgi:hypothetical protein
MGKVSLLVGLLVITAILSSCAMLDHSTDRYDNGNSSGLGGHSSHH